MTASCQPDILARDPSGHLALRQSIRNTAALVAVGPGASAECTDPLRTDSAAGDQPAVVAMAFDGQHDLDGELLADWPPEAEILFDAREDWERSIPLTE